jgi:hypothetical protein
MMSAAVPVLQISQLCADYKLFRHLPLYVPIGVYRTQYPGLEAAVRDVRRRCNHALTARPK